MWRYTNSIPSCLLILFHQSCCINSLLYFQNQNTHMAEDNIQNIVKIIEQCEVAPPHDSVPSTNLPLTYLDIPWFYCHLIKRIFFYEFPYPTQHFMQQTLPILKHSLSLTLQHFFPFVSKLIAPPHPLIPYIRYINGDSLSFTVAESDDADFKALISDSPQDVRDWHPFVPSMPSHVVEEDGTRVIPLMAIQVTVLPDSGFSLCLTFNHLAADGKSLHHFLKFWASLCKAKGNLASIQSSLPLPFHDRDKVKDPKGLKLHYLNELRDPISKGMEFAGIVRDVSSNKVHCRNNPELSLPSTYFGNCLASGIVAIKRGVIVGENGIIEIANAIEREVRDLKNDAMKKFDTLMSDYRELGKVEKSKLVIAGSPKLNVYDTDFGWGRPKKSESVHIETSGSISLSDCREKTSGIEVGLALERIQMNNFTNILEELLNNIVL
ncbi:putative anthocyanin 6''-O-malonyltransferase [Lupinus albus]|uniref:Putative anthocyanin 6''-O-malonyltransferase n=1 Tax=Lupinus albus TaxID=3870 RepID=A0A6A4P4X9_LUPAL|nr:putative anthocyanin 6''-O-malonyltransferase [Lupinus albus]UYR41670.1 anthocyanin 3-O-glucoside-6''-O-malonyltransferase [synthetic construct]